MSDHMESGQWSRILGHLQIPCPRFIGRESELLWLRERLEEARRGRGDLVFIAGEAGVGKSRLIEEMTVQAQQAEIRILGGKCSLFEAALPYAPFVEALRRLLQGRSPSKIAAALGPYAAETLKLLPELGPVLPAVRPNPPLNPADEKSRLFESLYQVLRRVAAQAPLILTIEDGHWADPASVEFLHFLARRLRDDLWLLLVTYRPEDLLRTENFSRLRQDLLRDRLAQELTLKPFGLAETADLVRTIVGEHAVVKESLTAWIFNFGDGNPFFSEEILRTLAEAADMPILDLDTRNLASIAIPATVRETIVARLNHLSPEARGILGTAAVLGSTFDVETLQEISGLAGEGFTEPFMSLLSVQLLRPDRTPLRYAFRHHVIREVVSSYIAPDVRRRLHERVGSLLEEREGSAAPPQMLAYHFNEAGDRPRAARYALAAGRQAAAVYGYEEAARFFADAMKMLPAGPGVARLEAAELLGDALEHSGQLAAATETFNQMRSWAEALEMRREVARAYRKIGTTQWRQAMWSGWDALEDALAIVMQIDDPAEEALIRDKLATIAFFTARYDDAQAQAQAAVTAAERAGDAAALARAYSVLGWVLMVTRRYDDARPYLRKSLELARQAGDIEGEMMARLRAGWLATYADADFQEAKAVLDPLPDLLKKTGEIPGPVCSLTILGGLRVLEGRWDEAEALFERIIGVLSREGQGRGADTPLAVELAMLWMLRGRLADAEALLVEAEASSEAQKDPREMSSVQWGKAQLAMRREQFAAAKGLLERGLELTQAPLYTTRNLSLLCDVLLRLGDIVGAQEAAAKATELAQFIRSMAPWTWRAQGDVAAQSGLLDDAVRCYQSGLDSLKTAPQPYQEALLRRSFGVALLRRNALGDRKAARIQLEESLKLLNRLGAGWDAEQARQVLGRISGRPPSGHALTEREREVLAALAEGLSNAAIAGRLHVSERTVQVHVSRILDKLGVENRTQAARAAVQGNPKAASQPEA